MLLGELWNDLYKLGTSTVYRERMTFIACCQDILLIDSVHVSFFSDTVVGILSKLAHDTIVDVRIRLSRFLGVFQGACCLPIYHDSR